jgi:Rho GTPase-activating protein 1
MHEVSLRASVNKMDAHNLTIVLCPNLVKGSNPIRDTLMCLLDGGPAILVSNLAPNSNGNAGSNEGTTTLGMVIKLCIQRYYEVFDETTDRNELVSADRVQVLNGEAQSHSSKTSPSLAPGPRPVLPTHLSPEEGEDDADEDIDDTMLVMPIEPGFGPGKHKSNTSVQWARGVQLSTPPVSLKGKKQPAQSFANDNHSSSPTSLSAHTHGSGVGSASPPYATMGKAKPNINIESGAGTWSSRGGKKGSISIGRSATGKSVGAGVEALGVTAAGFFAPPGTPPPMPGRKSSSSNDSSTT